MATLNSSAGLMATLSGLVGAAAAAQDGPQEAPPGSSSCKTDRAVDLLRYSRDLLDGSLCEDQIDTLRLQKHLEHTATSGW